MLARALRPTQTRHKNYAGDENLQKGNVDASEVVVVGDERRLDLVGREPQVRLDHRLEHLQIRTRLRRREAENQQMAKGKRKP